MTCKNSTCNWKTTWNDRCDTCYDSGRTLRTLNDKRILEAICPAYLQTSSVFNICWECEAVLRKLGKFQKKVQLTMSYKSQAAKGIYKRTNGLSVLKTTDVEILSITPIDSETENMELSDNEHMSDGEEDDINEEDNTNEETNCIDEQSELQYVIKVEPMSRKDSTETTDVAPIKENKLSNVPGFSVSLQEEDSDTPRRSSRTNYKCKVSDCSFKGYFPSEAEVEKHTQDVHNAYKCIVCEEEFRSDKKRQEHHKYVHYLQKTQEQSTEDETTDVTEGVTSLRPYYSLERFEDPNRSSHPSKAQITALLDFLERQPKWLISNSNRKTAHVKREMNKAWQTITPKLNLIGDAYKDKKRWMKEPYGNSSTAASNDMNIFEAQSVQTYNLLSDNPGNQPSMETEPNSDIQNILQNQSILLDITNQIVESQKRIIHQLTNITIQIEKSSKIDTPNNNTVPLNASSAESDSFILKQIKNIQDLDEMEKLLSDNDRKKQLKKSCAVICSSGAGNGTNCAYRFADILFSREFLCECSWSGNTRQDGVKISLKCYKNILHFFFEMINKWDSTFTYEANEAFFKMILKNSTKRKSAKLERIPTKRHRSKGLKQKTMSIEGRGAGPIDDDDEESKNIKKIRDIESEAKRKGSEVS